MSTEPPAGPDTPDRHTPAAQLAEHIQAAITAAGARCQHYDPGSPIYQPVRPCPVCATDAAMALFPDVILEARSAPGQHPLDDAPLRYRYVAFAAWDAPPPAAHA